MPKTKAQKIVEAKKKAVAKAHASRVKKKK